MIGMWGVGHNFMHQSTRKAGMWKHSMAVIPGMIPQNFQVTHALSHHAVPNLLCDYESGFYTSNGTFIRVYGRGAARAGWGGAGCRRNAQECWRRISVRGAWRA